MPQRICSYCKKGEEYCVCRKKQIALIEQESILSIEVNRTKIAYDKMFEIYEHVKVNLIDVKNRTYD